MNLVSSAARRAAPLVNLIRGTLSRRGHLAPPQSRADFLAALSNRETLEIGPFDNPTLMGPDVKYFDVLDTTGLRERAAKIGRSPASVPSIDYYSPFGDLSVVDKQFDAVVSSHAIEHQPDLIKHLSDVAALLRPGGRYYIIAPDKRFCFDHFLPLSSVKDVIAAHVAQRRVHTRAAVLAHRLDTAHNNSVRHWFGLHGPKPAPNVAVRNAAEADAARADTGEYVDVHAWIFSPQRFYDVITDLRQQKLTDLDLVIVHDTAFPQLEYFAVLEKCVVPASIAMEANN